MARRSRESRTTHFEQVPVVDIEAAAIQAANDATPDNITFEPASADKTEPYSFRPEALQYARRRD
jgi:hypothetical protein